MSSTPDLYACLGVPRKATPEQIRQAYQFAARRFHPDINHDLQAPEEFKIITFAYEVLNDPQRRAEYDIRLAANPKSTFTSNIQCSRTKLMRLPEAQVVYVLANVAPAPAPKTARPPINLCLVVDRSTSMQGARLDQVNTSAQQIVESLRATDTFAVIAFSDRAEVVVPAQPCTNKPAIISKLSTIHAGGGTEILQGLLCGLTELQRAVNPDTINHLILLTDGRTYGDEDDCLLLALLAQSDGITISGLGLGDEWNDAFVDRLAGLTGGVSRYISTPAVVTRLLAEHVHGLGDSLGRVQIQTTCDPGVRLVSAFRVAPDAQPLVTDSQPIKLGHLHHGEPISVLLEFTVTSTPDPERPMARLWVIGDILSAGKTGERWPTDIRLQQTDTADAAAPPPDIVTALDKLTLYRLQEKAWADAEEGNIAKATQRLQSLASRLQATGQHELATVALAEAARLNQTRQISAENRKRIKYGTRALIPPSSKT
jgi:Ca-activated chloride channel family protein